MTPTNVVSMNFKNKASLDEFINMYQNDSPKLYPDAEMLMFIKLTDTSAIAISVYPNEEARINSKKLAESRVGPFTPDVMALLNHGLQKPDPQVQRQALVCLHALVFSLSKFVKGQLATLLHQIVVMVLPFAEMAQTNGQGGLEFIFEVEVKQIL